MMHEQSPRLNIQLHVFTLGVQRASVQADLTPHQLIAAALTEFRELLYLSTDPTEYMLRPQDAPTPLADTAALAAHVADGTVLVLEERPILVPEGMAAPTQAIYLREEARGHVYRIAWLPAFIGRSDATTNDLVAVDLGAYPAGQRVSRQHVRLIEQNGILAVELLSANPTVIESADGQRVVAEQTPTPIVAGDTIVLERSQIQLTLLVREPS